MQLGVPTDILGNHSPDTAVQGNVVEPERLAVGPVVKDQTLSVRCPVERPVTAIVERRREQLPVSGTVRGYRHDGDRVVGVIGPDEEGQSAGGHDTDPGSRREPGPVSPNAAAAQRYAGDGPRARRAVHRQGGGIGRQRHGLRSGVPESVHHARDDGEPAAHQHRRVDRCETDLRGTAGQDLERQGIGESQSRRAYSEPRGPRGGRPVHQHPRAAIGVRRVRDGTTPVPLQRGHEDLCDAGQLVARSLEDDSLVRERGTARCLQSDQDGGFPPAIDRVSRGNPSHEIEPGLVRAISPRHIAASHETGQNSHPSTATHTPHLSHDSGTRS